MRTKTKTERCPNHIGRKMAPAAEIQVGGRGYCLDCGYAMRVFLADLRIAEAARDERLALEVMRPEVKA